MATTGTPLAKLSRMTSGRASLIEVSTVRPSLGKISSGFWKPRNFTLPPRPSAAHQLVALAGVLLVLVLGAHDPGLGLGHGRHHRAHGPDEAAHVLDGHHPPDEADHRRHPVAVLAAARPRSARRSMPLGITRVRAVVGAVADLAGPVALVERDDGVGGGVGQPADALEEAQPQPAHVGAVLLQAAAQLLGGVLDPVGVGQIDLAFLGVDAVLGEDVGAAGAGAAAASPGTRRTRSRPSAAP